MANFSKSTVMLLSSTKKCGPLPPSSPMSMILVDILKSQLFSHFDRKKLPPPWGVSFLGGFQMKSLDEKEKEPIFHKKIGLFSRRSLPLGFSFGTYPKKTPGEVLSINVTQYNEWCADFCEFLPLCCQAHKR